MTQRQTPDEFLAVVPAHPFHRQVVAALAAGIVRHHGVPGCLGDFAATEENAACDAQHPAIGGGDAAARDQQQVDAIALLHQRQGRETLVFRRVRVQARGQPQPDERRRHQRRQQDEPRIDPREAHGTSAPEIRNGYPGTVVKPAHSNAASPFAPSPP